MPERRRFEHLNKIILCARSEYFNTLFRSGMAEGASTSTSMTSGGAGGAGAETEVPVPDADPDAFQCLLDYIATDEVAFAPGGGAEEARRAFLTMQLAHKHGMVRLERLCQRALEEGDLLSPASAVPLLEGACAAGEGGERVVTTCREYMVAQGHAVAEAGGLDALRELPVARGLLRDSYEEVERQRKEIDRLNGCSAGTSRKRRREGD